VVKSPGMLSGLFFQAVETIFDAADILFDDLDIPSLAGGDSKQNGEIFVDLSHMARLHKRDGLFCLSFILRAAFNLVWAKLPALLSKRPTFLLQQPYLAV
jgi:hypothetical protein